MEKTGVTLCALILTAACASKPLEQHTADELTEMYANPSACRDEIRLGGLAPDPVKCARDAPAERERIAVAYQEVIAKAVAASPPCLNEYKPTPAALALAQVDPGLSNATARILLAGVAVTTLPPQCMAQACSWLKQFDAKKGAELCRRSEQWSQQTAGLM